MEIALSKWAERFQRCRGKAHLDEIPFDADRKRCPCSTRFPGPSAVCQKARSSVLPAMRVRPHDGGVVPATDAHRADFLAAENRLGERGLRVLAPWPGERWKKDWLGRWERDLILCGLVGNRRDRVPEAMRRCRDAGSRVIMHRRPRRPRRPSHARDRASATSAHPAWSPGRSWCSRPQLRSPSTRGIIFARMAADQAPGGEGAARRRTRSSR